MIALLRLTLFPHSEHGQGIPHFSELWTSLKARSRKAFVFRTHSCEWQPLSFQPLYIQLRSSTDMSSYCNTTNPCSISKNLSKPQDNSTCTEEMRQDKFHSHLQALLAQQHKCRSLPFLSPPIFLAKIKIFSPRLNLKCACQKCKFITVSWVQILTHMSRPQILGTHKFDLDL